jgi:hypothetical protein
MRRTIGGLVILLALVAGPQARAQERVATEESTATTSELKERIRRGLEEANSLHQESVRLRDLSNRREEEAEAKRGEVTRLQAELVSRDARLGADKLKIITLRRDADEDELLAAAAERSSREQKQRADHLRNDAQDQRALSDSRRKLSISESDATRRQRLEFQSKALASEADRKEREADRLEREAKDADSRVQRFRDDARRSREEADRIEKRLGGAGAVEPAPKE